MQITYVERQKDKISQALIYADGKHQMTIYYKNGTVDLSKYPTTPNQVTETLLQGFPTDELLYAVGCVHAPYDNLIHLLGVSSQGRHICKIREEDVYFLNEEKMLQWDLERFKLFTEDMM